MSDNDKKYSPEDSIKTLKQFPANLLKVVYDKDDNVLFGNRYTKGKVQYHYIPAEYMTTKRPFIVSTSISYDGKGNIDLPKDSIVRAFNELPIMFPDNKFGS